MERKLLQRYTSANEGVNLYFDHQWGGEMGLLSSH